MGAGAPASDNISPRLQPNTTVRNNATSQTTYLAFSRDDAIHLKRLQTVRASLNPPQSKLSKLELQHHESDSYINDFFHNRVAFRICNRMKSTCQGGITNNKQSAKSDQNEKHRLHSCSFAITVQTVRNQNKTTQRAISVETETMKKIEKIDRRRTSRRSVPTIPG